MSMCLDEECGRPIHAAPDPAHEILTNPRCKRVLCNRLTDLFLVESKFLVRKLQEEFLVVERFLVLINEIVHFPELALGRGGLSHFSTEFCSRMNVGQREVTKYEPEIVSKLFLNLLNYRIGFATVRALVVAIFHQHDLRSTWTLKVISPLTDRQSQSRRILDALYPFTACSHPSFATQGYRPDFSCWGYISSSALIIPSAPGFTPTGDR